MPRNTQAQSSTADDGPLLAHLSPLGWKHINLTGDYNINDEIIAHIRVASFVVADFTGHRGGSTLRLGLPLA